MMIFTATISFKSPLGYLLQPDSVLVHFQASTVFEMLGDTVLTSVGRHSWRSALSSALES